MTLKEYFKKIGANGKKEFALAIHYSGLHVKKLHYFYTYLNMQPSISNKISHTVTFLDSERFNAKQQIEVYQLNERDSYLLVARLSPEYTAQLVDEWRRLKDLTTPTLPQTKLAWMKLAVAQEEKLQSQQQLLEEALPKIEFAEQVSAAKGVMTFSEAAKKLKLGYGRNTLFQKLHDVGYLYTHGREKNMPKQHLTESGSGYFTVKESIYKNSKNEPCSTSTTLITPRGLLAISKKLAALDTETALRG